MSGDFEHNEPMGASGISRHLTEQVAGQLNDMLDEASEDPETNMDGHGITDYDPPPPPPGSPTHDLELRQIAFVEDVANQFITLHLQLNRGEPNFAFTGTLKKAVEQLAIIAMHPTDDRAYIKMPQVLGLLRESVD